MIKTYRDWIYFWLRFTSYISNPCLYMMMSWHLEYCGDVQNRSEQVTINSQYILMFWIKLSLIDAQDCSDVEFFVCSTPYRVQFVFWTENSTQVDYFISRRTLRIGWSGLNRQIFLSVSIIIKLALGSLLFKAPGTFWLEVFILVRVQTLDQKVFVIIKCLSAKKNCIVYNFQA